MTSILIERIMPCEDGDRGKPRTAGSHQSLGKRHGTASLRASGRVYLNFKTSGLTVRGFFVVLSHGLGKFVMAATENSNTKALSILTIILTVPTLC